MGCHAVSFSENPAKLKLPSFHSDHWDPFWSACSDEGTIVCLHIGSSSSLVITAADAPIDVLLALQPVNIIQAAADLLWSPVLRKFPELKVSLSEGGIGWIPYFLERMDWTYERQHGWTGQDFGDRLPSEVFREHIVTCFIDDPAGVAQRDQVGLDTICWESDYPHSDSTWPVSPERLMRSMGGVPDDEIDAMTHETPCATSGSTPSRSGRASSARSDRCEQVRAMWTSTSPRAGARSTQRDASQARAVMTSEPDGQVKVTGPDGSTEAWTARNGSLRDQIPPVPGPPSSVGVLYDFPQHDGGASVEEAIMLGVAEAARAAASTVRSSS